MSDIKKEQGFKLGLMIDGCMYAVEQDIVGNDVTIYRENKVVALFEGKDDFFEFLNLLCIARGKMEKG